MSGPGRARADLAEMQPSVLRRSTIRAEPHLGGVRRPGGGACGGVRGSG
ncbi:hypothetical protein Ae263Ps1_1070c [Pseudonocardia sp. Ae263_Ps1]|nr:hypothetical protein Ae150APs1_4253 [Pseudonocardia sp. Ae150A_Ps1]OLL84015.1 hypothetical protein Ae263Ps1_1070c [Pseudonocardia sp. Ae263_Ps1]